METFSSILLKINRTKDNMNNTNFGKRDSFIRFMCINVNLHVYNTIVISDTRLNFTSLLIETFSSFYYQVYDLLYFEIPNFIRSCYGVIENLCISSYLNVVVVDHYTLRDTATEIFKVLFNRSMHVYSSLAPFSSLASFARVVHLLSSSAIVTVLRQIAQHTMCTFSKVRHSLTPPSTLGHASRLLASINSLTSYISSGSLISRDSSVHAWSVDGMDAVQILLLLFCLLLVSLLVLCSFFLFRIAELLRTRLSVTHTHYHYHNTYKSIKTNNHSIKTNGSLVDQSSFSNLALGRSSCFPLFDNVVMLGSKCDKPFPFVDMPNGCYSQDLTVMMATVGDLPDQLSEAAQDEVQSASLSAVEEPSDTDQELPEAVSVKSEKVKRRSSHHLIVPEFSIQLTSSRETTPDKKLEKRIRSASWGGCNRESQDTEGEVSSGSISSSQQSTGSKKKDSWIREDGCVTMDRMKSCHVGFINNYIETDGALSLKNDLITAIDKTCSFANSKRFKIELGDGLPSNHSDIDTKKKGKRNPKMSVATVNLGEKSELASLAIQYRDKISRSVKEVLNLDAEFDRVVIHRFSGPEDSIPYESAFKDELSGFSPTVAVLCVGQPDTGARPMFMKTKTGSIVTHKIALASGSLCTLSGRTECRYRRSIPKDYGVKGDQFFLFFIQRTPDSSILCELMKIPIQSDSCPKQSNPKTKDSLLSDIPAKTELSPDSLLEPQKTTEDHSCNTVMEQILKTPPTVKRVVPEGIAEPFTFLDAMDFEVNGGLLLAESLGTAVNNMDGETLTRELIRNHTSIAGTEEQKKTRLQQKLSMTIGELTTTAANNSVNMTQLLSPTESVQTLRQDLERVSNSQVCIENTLTDVIDTIVNIREDISGIRTDNSVLKEELSNPPPCPNSSAGNKDLAHKISECTNKIKQLNENIAAIREDIAEVQDTVTTLSASTQESLKDWQAWHNSAFSDEDSQRIKTVYDHILKYQDTPDSIMYIQHRSCQTDAHIDIQTTAQVDEEQSPEVEQVQIRETPPEQQTASVSEPTTFDWPEPMYLSLKTALLSNKPIRVCLITDSIMRHITETNLLFRQYRVHLDRMDRNNTEALARRELRDTIKKKKPHLLFIHLGINDIHMGTSVSEIMENIANFESFLEAECPDTKVIFSKPLLNGKLHHDRAVLDLRKSLERHKNTHDSNRDIVNQRLFTQDNDNFMVQTSDDEACQKMRYYNQDDLLHLSKKGRDTMVCIVRDSLHKIFRRYVHNSLR